MKIVKEGRIIECSKNTFETMYKRLGYSIVEEKAKTAKEVIVPEEKVEEVVADEVTVKEPVVEETITKGKASKKK